MVADADGIAPGGAPPRHWASFAAGLADGRARDLTAAAAAAAAVNELEPIMKALDDAGLAAETERLKAARRSGAPLDALLPRAFAAVREAARRVLGLRAYDVQLVGAAVLHAGRVAEMKTGEGKTLVAAFAAYLNALDGRGVHVITVNDYLATRDRAWVGRVLEFLGLTVDVVTEATPHASRRAAFAADVTYVTASQLAFTYLRDNSAARAKGDVALTRRFHYAIVDEADSILIDDCRTPMILSGSPLPTDESRFRLAQQVVEVGGEGGGWMREAPSDPETGKALPGATGDFTLDVRRHRVSLTAAGSARALHALRELGASVPENADAAALWAADATLSDPWGPYLVNALKANSLYRRDVHYIVRGDHAKIVDASTGRVLPLSRWTDNMHQAVEAKERLPIRGASVNQGTVTFQTLFRGYKKLSGMTGTAAREAEELHDVYGVDVAPVPPHRPSRRVDRSPRVYFDGSGKRAMLALLLAGAAGTARPVLIGTRTVEESEAVSAALDGGLADAADALRADFPGLFPSSGPSPPPPIRHALLNARPDRAAAEAAVVSQAGLPGAVTVATSMAGRGTDVLLGGHPRGLAAGLLLRRLGALLGGAPDDGGVPPSPPSPDCECAPPPAVAGALARAAAELKAAAGPLEEPAGGYAAAGLLAVDAVAEPGGSGSDSERDSERGDDDAGRPPRAPAGPAPAEIAAAEVELALRAAERVRSEWLTEAGDDGAAGVSVSARFARSLAAVRPRADAAFPPAAGPRPALAAAALTAWLWYDALCARLAADVRAAGGLLVICASLLDSARATDQLLGRCGRQGDPGETWVVLEAGDTGPEVGDVAGSLTAFTAAVSAAAALPPLDACAVDGVARAFLRLAQGRAEAAAGSARREVKQVDDVVAPLRAHVYALRRLLVCGGPGRVRSLAGALLADVAADIAAVATADGSTLPTPKAAAAAVAAVRVLATSPRAPKIVFTVPDDGGSAADLGAEARKVADISGRPVLVPTGSPVPFGVGTDANAGAALVDHVLAAAKGPGPPAPARGALERASPATLPGRAARALAAALADELVMAADARRAGVERALAAKYSLPGELPPNLTTPTAASWESEVALGALDDLWADFLVDADNLESATALRAFGHLAPLDEFRLEASSLFAALLADYRWQVAGELCAGPTLAVRPSRGGGDGGEGG